MRFPFLPPESNQPDRPPPHQPSPPGDRPLREPPFREPPFRDRLHAGKLLAQRLSAEGASRDWMIYGIPNGGLIVAQAVAQTLNCPLDVVVAKKITLPTAPEYALGAITPQGPAVFPHGIGSQDPPPPESQAHRLYEAQILAQTLAQQRAEAFSPHRPRCNAPQQGVLIDDGVATGLTLIAAAQALKHQGVAQLWIAVPIAPASGWSSLGKALNAMAERLIVLVTPEPFHAVSQAYENFDQVELEAAIAALRAANI